MPTYKYRREDGTTFTIRQKITADPLEKCPETDQSVERVITGGLGFQLKGGGWYEDGYTRSGASEEDPSGNGESDTQTSDDAAGDGGSGETSAASKSEEAAAQDAS